MTNEKMKKRVMELLLVLAGNVLMSIGVGAFVIPEELMSGGATGLGLLAAHYFHIPVAVFLGGYNAIMFVVGALTLGKHFAGHDADQQLSVPVPFKPDPACGH